MRRVCVACAVLVASGAAAEEYAPKPVHVSGRLDGDTARFTVRYLLHANGPSFEPSGLDSFALPSHGLVTAASVVEGGQRHILDLTLAEEATKTFGALGDKPPGRARRWAVMLEDEHGMGAFSVSTATPRQASMVLEVEVSVPTCFRRDARYVAVPKSWASKVATVRHDEDLDVACSLPSEDFVWTKFEATHLAKQAPWARIGTIGGRVSLSGTDVAKVELDLAGKLSDVPADLATAIVVDASRSMTAQELDSQREAIAAYLRAAPNSRVQVIAYSRRARALLPSWTVASQGAARIDRELRALDRSNGSAIDAGTRLAGNWLDQITGTRRILLFTDERLSFKSERTRAIDDAVPAKTLVHVVALNGSGFTRDDGAKLARIALRSHGMAVRGGATDDGKLDATMLVRPISLDHVRLHAAGFRSLVNNVDACPDTEVDDRSFAEGESCRWFGEGGMMTPITIEGQLWGERIVRVIRTDLDRARDVAREISTMSILKEDLQHLAERTARAVNSVWSFYGSWGGNDGYNDGFGLIGRGMSGSICGCDDVGIGIGHTIGFGTGLPDLEGKLARVARACALAQPVDLEVETTFEEIVDVSVTSSDATTRTCVEEALWGAWLAVPGAPDHTITHVHVTP